ncbi:MAG TPA: SMP-30/gluconolactonase/LRE family protein, partial [Polyangiaceae bacterium]|nr:SMP-30/gluconolactonase/LRE family protein [Polyangiaceae bacterium]
MKRCFACASVWLLAIGCGTSSDPNIAPPNKGGASGTAGSPAANAGGGSANLGGSGPSAGGSGNSGGSAPVGGSANVAGSGSGGTPATGGSPGSGGSGSPGGAAGAGAAGGSSGGAYKCPAGSAGFTPPSGMAMKVAGTPPADSFNKDAWTNVEGPVWIGDALYFSEMTNSNMTPPSRILKLAAGGAVSVFAADAGTNGLAVDGSGNLIAAVHKDGSISQIALSNGAATPLVSMYMSKRFTSPNDLAIRSDGTIYFSDPSYQNSANPQGAERLYRVTPGPTRTVSVVDGAPTPPNGVTLSPDEKTLYVSANNSGLKKFTVMSDGSLGAASDFVAGSGGDGMAVDCAGDLFVTGNNAATVRVYSPAGALLTTIQLASGAGNTTNV